MVEMGGFEPPFAACAPVSLTHGCSCRELQNAITTLPHLHGEVLVFPSRQHNHTALRLFISRTLFLRINCPPLWPQLVCT